MDQVWHTKGYKKLAHATMYLGMSLNAGQITPEQFRDALAVLTACGRLIRREHETVS